MQAVGSLSVVNLSTATPGLLLLGRTNSEPCPMLTITVDGPRGPQPGYIILDGSEHSFTAAYSAGGTSLYLATSRWELRVDPTSAYTGTVEMPVPGDAFISDGTPGILARFNYGTVYISLTGQFLEEPNWTNGFVGFRKWSLVHWPVEDEDAVEIIVHERPAPQR